MSRNAPHPLTLRTARLALLAFVAGLAAMLAPSPASAAITINGADKAGDQAQKPFDLVSGRIVYDDKAGKLTVNAQTAAPNATIKPYSLFVLIGTAAANGECLADAETTTILAATLAWTAEGIDLASYFVSDNIEAIGTFKASRAGANVSATATAPGLKGKNWNCARLYTQAATDTEGEPLDEVVIFEGGAAAPVFTDQPDKDKDGTPDTTDACPTVAGAARNGCLTIPARLAIRLGAKRVAIDKLAARSARLCPLKAKVTVKDGKKTIGTGVVSVTTHGSFCRAFGVVKLKKSAKKKAKITVKATGMSTISANRKR